MGESLAIKENVRNSLLEFYTRDQLDDILRALVTPCTLTTLRVNTLKITREDALSQINDLLAPFVGIAHYLILLSIDYCLAQRN